MELLDKKWKRITAVALILAILTALTLRSKFKSTDDRKKAELSYISYTEENTEDSYADFLSENSGNNSAQQESRADFSNDENTYRLVSAGTEATTEFQVEQAGLYAVKLEYSAIGDTVYDYTFSMKINGRYQYNEMKNLAVRGQWEIDKNNSKEGFSPKLIKNGGKLQAWLYDRNYYYASPLQIYLNKCVNTVSIKAGDYDIGIYSLVFAPEKAIPTYKNYSSSLSMKGGSPIFIEGENASYRSSSSILELSDSTSPETSPLSIGKSIKNTIGGETFKNSGESLTWEFDVESAGTYYLNIRYRQDFTNGTTAYRTVLIDGEPCFDGCVNAEFAYSNGFQRFVLGGEKSPQAIELSKGRHTVTLLVTLGNNGKIIQQANRILERLNYLYRCVMVLTGATPDPYRNYLIEEKLPDVVAEIDIQRKNLQNMSDYIYYISGKGDTSEIDTLVRQLSDFYENPDYIPVQLSSFSNNLSALATWINARKEQPLEIDWLAFTPINEKMPETDAGLLRRFAFSVKQFCASFADKYNADMSGNAKSIEVWTTVGRDQVNIITDIISEKFTPSSGISVKLKLVSAGVQLPAVVSGIGPDVSLFNGNTDIINFAARDAIADLSEMDGFDSLKSSFYESALIPVTIGDKVYGLPEKLTFPVMFYRKDILNELNLEVPETWDDASSTMFELLKNNMEFGVPSTMGSYVMFLYQNGGSLYNEERSECLLDTPVSMTAFGQWTKLYIDLGMPISYNFINRFRSGQMPIAIEDYTMYNTLTVTAPEIEDLWDIARVPGTVKDDGSTDCSVASGGTGAMLFKSCEDKGAAWDFMKWWCSSDTQKEYANSVESKLGPSARYPTANKIAFDGLMWTPKQLSVLNDQLEFVKGVPEVIGGYYTSRHITNAYRKIVLSNAEINETLKEYNLLINEEITKKRIELNMDGKD